MWFAVLACISGVLAMFGSWRVVRAQPSPDALEACLRSLRNDAAATLAVGDELSATVGELIQRIDRAGSRSIAVGELNEFIAEIDRESGAEVPLTLARVCFTVGLLLGVLALAGGLGAGRSVGLETAAPALLAVTAGVASGTVCYQLGLSAKQRHREFRGVVRRLTQLLEQRLPARDA